MSIINSIEAEFQSIIADARSVPEKLAALVGLHTKSQELAQIEPQLVALIDNTGIPSPEKVEQILKMVGKL